MICSYSVLKVLDSACKLASVANQEKAIRKSLILLFCRSSLETYCYQQWLLRIVDQLQLLLQRYYSWCSYNSSFATVSQSSSSSSSNRSRQLLLAPSRSDDEVHQRWSHVLSQRGIWRPRDFQNHPWIWKKNIPGQFWPTELFGA